jgi:hypothetical protein
LRSYSGSFEVHYLLIQANQKYLCWYSGGYPSPVALSPDGGSSCSSSVIVDGGVPSTSPPSSVSSLGGDGGESSSISGADGSPPPPSSTPTSGGGGDIASPVSFEGGGTAPGENNAPGGCPSPPVSGGSNTPGRSSPSSLHDINSR